MKMARYFRRTEKMNQDEKYMKAFQHLWEQIENDNPPGIRRGMHPLYYTYCLAREAIGKRIGVQPKYVGDGYVPVYDKWRCPDCRSRYELDRKYNYCPNCGQRIAWEKVRK